MIKAVFLDLDDTLVESNTAQSFPAYLKMLGEFGASVAPPDVFVRHIMASYAAVLGDWDATQTLYEKFMPLMSMATGHDAKGLAELFTAFYADCYSILRPMVKPRAASRTLLDYLFSHNYQVAVATNPGLPESAIYQRMEWGEVPADREPFALITTLESMHFGKPHPEYYEEIMARLAINPGEAIMVGDDWDNDMVGAAKAGLLTYWISEDGSQPPPSNITLSDYGSYQRFVELVQGGWLETLSPAMPDSDTLIHRLRAFPASIDALRRSYRAEILECPPAPKEWSARDIICHLRDHEGVEDRPRLKRIATESNPFLSANYDPWAHAAEYSSVHADQALTDFAHNRSITVDWLLNLQPEIWQRPARYAIFGPTDFQEMVRFTTEHDLTHLRQMRRAISFAIETCGA